MRSDILYIAENLFHYFEVYEYDRDFWDGIEEIEYDEAIEKICKVLLKDHTRIIELLEDTDSNIPEEAEDQHEDIATFLEQLENLFLFKGALIEARKEKNLTQRDVWHTLEIPSRTYESWEMGEKEPATWVQKLVLDAIERM